MFVKLVALFVFWSQILCVFGQENNSNTLLIIKKINKYSQENIFPILKNERTELLKKFSKQDYEKWTALAQNRKKYQIEKKKWLTLDPENTPNIMDIWDNLQKDDKLHGLEADKLAQKYEKNWQIHLAKLKPKISQWEIEIQNIILQSQINLEAEQNRLFKKPQSEKMFFLIEILLETFDKEDIILPVKSNENAAEDGR